MQQAVSAKSKNNNNHKKIPLFARHIRQNLQCLKNISEALIVSIPLYLEILLYAHHAHSRGLKGLGWKIFSPP